jgi:hypothetical protein
MSETRKIPRRPPAKGVNKIVRNKRLPPAAGRGRPKGSPNKVSADEKALLAKLAHWGLERAQGWLERVARRSPARALTITAKICEYVVPKLRSMEVSGPEGAPLPAPSFAFTMPHGGPGTEGPQGSACDVEVSGEHGSEDEQPALPAPSSEPDVPLYVQQALPAPTSEASPIPNAPPAVPPPPARRIVRVAHAEDFEDPALIEEANRFEQRRSAGIPQSRPRPQVELLLYARERRRRQEARGDIEADSYLVSEDVKPATAADTEEERKRMATQELWGQLGR